MSTSTPPYRATFGHGAPGGTVNKAMPYYDIDAGYSEYVYNPTVPAWEAVASSAPTSLAALTDVDLTAPSNGQILEFSVAAGNKWINATPGGGGSPPTIVQSAIACGNVTSVTLPGAPAKGNLLVALVSHFSNNIVAGAPAGPKGWSCYNQTNGASFDGYALFYRIAGGTEIAAQTVLGSSPSQGVIALWEITGGSKIIDVYSGQHDVNATPSITQSVTTANNDELILLLFATSDNNTNNATSVSNCTQDQAATGGNRAGTSAHVTAAVAGVFNPSATWAANPTSVVTIGIAIG